MVTRGDILWLGISSGVTGGLLGGLFLTAGMYLATLGKPFGWVLLMIGGPGSGVIGWLLARRLATQLTPDIQ